MMHQAEQHNTQQFYARMAGLSYVIFTLAGMVKNFLLETGLSSVGAQPLISIFANEQHFRLGIFAETIMFLGVVMASVSFYMVLKPVSKALAQTALCCRLVEIIIGSLAVVISMAMLALSHKASLSDFLEMEQLRNLILIAASFRLPAYEYSWIFMGFAGVITFYLFFKTRYLPRIWSVWGMITYSSLILYPTAKILIAELPREVMYVMFPGALFELGVGIWLLTKGIRITTDTDLAPEQALKAA